MTAQGNHRNLYGSVVAKDANKLQIRQAVEELYDVKVADVNTMRYAGKRKQRHTKSGISVGQTSSYKKAVVTLAEGDVIDFYSNI